MKLIIEKHGEKTYSTMLERKNFAFLTLRFLSSGNFPSRTPSMASETQALHDTWMQSTLRHSIKTSLIQGDASNRFSRSMQ